MEELRARDGPGFRRQIGEDVMPNSLGRGVARSGGVEYRGVIAGQGAGAGKSSLGGGSQDDLVRVAGVDVAGMRHW